MAPYICALVHTTYVRENRITKPQVDRPTLTLVSTSEPCTFSCAIYVACNIPAMVGSSSSVLTKLLIRFFAFILVNGTRILTRGFNKQKGVSSSMNIRFVNVDMRRKDALVVCGLLLPACNSKAASKWSRTPHRLVRLGIHESLIAGPKWLDERGLVCSLFHRYLLVKVGSDSAVSLTDALAEYSPNGMVWHTNEPRPARDGLYALPDPQRRKTDTHTRTRAQKTASHRWNQQ